MSMLRFVAGGAGGNRASSGPRDRAQRLERVCPPWRQLEPFDRRAAPFGSPPLSGIGMPRQQNIACPHGQTCLPGECGGGGDGGAAVTARATVAASAAASRLRKCQKATIKVVVFYPWVGGPALGGPSASPLWMRRRRRRWCSCDSSRYCCCFCCVLMAKISKSLPVPMGKNASLVGAAAAATVLQL